MKERYYELYRVADSIFVKALRALFLFFALGPLILTEGSTLSKIFGISFGNSYGIQYYLSVFVLVLINELFIESLGKTNPLKKALEKDGNPKDSLVFPARKKFDQSKNSFEFVNKIKNEKSVKFFRDKLGIEKIEDTKIPKDELLKQALEAVTFVKGDYITEVDLFASYILLSEDSTGLLKTNNLNNDDVINILYWARRKFEPDKFENNKITLLGPGVFDDLVYGWNYELKKYSKDLTWEILSRRFPPNIIGAEKSYKELEVALSKHKSSNAIITGEPGTGKRNLIEYFVHASFIGKTSSQTSHKKVYELLVDKLLSGAGNPGEIEGRLSEMLSEIAHSGNSIIFIQNIENIFGGGGFDFDISGVLDEYLTSEKIKIVGTTTPAGFANFVRPKTSIADQFEKIELTEPTDGKTLLLLTEKAPEIESKYKAKVKYPALKQAVVLAPIYFPERFFPGSAIDLIESVASKAQIEKNKTVDGPSVIEFVQSKTNIILEDPDKNEKELLIHLEEKLHARVIGQNEGIAAVANSMRRLRSGFKNENRPISTFLFLGPTGVGKTETAKALAAEYFGAEDAMIRLDMSEYQTQDQLKRILGGTSGEYVANTLVAQITQKPFSLVLLDEFEKAHPQILNIFLQVFDEGRLTDNQGKTVSFKNAIIIATSNAGTELVHEKQVAGAGVTKQELVDYLLQNNVFAPELINRFDDVVLFKFLTEEEVKQIAGLVLTDVLAKLSEKQIDVSFDDSVLSKIAAESYNTEFGARNVRRYIEQNIENVLSNAILENKIGQGDKIALSVDESGALVIR